MASSGVSPAREVNKRRNYAKRDDLAHVSRVPCRVFAGPGGGIGRRSGLKIRRLLQPCRFDSGSGHHSGFRPLDPAWPVGTSLDDRVKVFLPHQCGYYVLIPYAAEVLDAEQTGNAPHTHQFFEVLVADRKHQYLHLDAVLLSGRRCSAS